MLTDYENNLAFLQSLNVILMSLIKESEETDETKKNNKIVSNTNISHSLLSLVLSEACKVV